MTAGVRTRSDAETEDVGRALAPRTAPGEAVLLSGDLGAGKTVFVRGLAAGLGANPADVTSPTFALVHEYGPLDGPLLVHVDRYRLAGGEDRDLGLDEPRVAAAVLAVEWPAPADRERPGWDVDIAIATDGSRLVRATRRPGTGIRSGR